MRLTDLLTENKIKIHLQSAQRDQVIKELVQLLQNDITDINQAFNAILEREKIMTTGVGNGIAIPHCKHQSCPDFVLALGIAKKSVDFSSIDQKPVDLIFLLLGPENNPGIHIKLLSRISRLMSNKDMRHNLAAAKSATEAFKLVMEEEESYPDIE